MPLMISPVDGRPMRQVIRFGVNVDVCPTTGGVWMDREAFQKLTAQIREESRSDRLVHAGGHRPDPERRAWSDENEEDDDFGDSRYRRRRRKSGLDDLFDF